MIILIISDHQKCSIIFAKLGVSQDLFCFAKSRFLSFFQRCRFLVQSLNSRWVDGGWVPLVLKLVTATGSLPALWFQRHTFSRDDETWWNHYCGTCFLISGWLALQHFCSASKYINVGHWIVWGWVNHSTTLIGGHPRWNMYIYRLNFTYAYHISCIRQKQTRKKMPISGVHH